MLKSIESMKKGKLNNAVCTNPHFKHCLGGAIIASYSVAHNVMLNKTQLPNPILFC